MGGAESGGAAEGHLPAKVASAVCYGLSSILVVFVNKVLLTNLRFPSFLWVAVGQMAVTVALLQMAKCAGLIALPKLDRSIPRRIFPLPLFYLLNLASGLGGTQRISLPMFTVLRRFSILLTMVLEYLLLGVMPSFAVKASVFLMMAGSFIAALNDLSFDTYGYCLIFVNNVFTAANGVYVKKKLEAKDLGKYGLLYYNALFMLLPALLVTLHTDDSEKVARYFDEGRLTATVLVCFGLSCVCGFWLNYSLVMCSTYNSALTTTCVGPIKNLFVTYVGMFSSGDYVFHWANFLGVNVSVFGSILYTYVTFRTSTKPSKSITVRATERRANSPSRLPLTV